MATVLRNKASGAEFAIEGKSFGEYFVVGSKTKSGTRLSLADVLHIGPERALLDVAIEDPRGTMVGVITDIETDRKSGRILKLLVSPQ